MPQIVTKRYMIEQRCRIDKLCKGSFPLVFTWGIMQVIKETSDYFQSAASQYKAL